jgi:hypothetical protein
LKHPSQKVSRKKTNWKRFAKYAIPIIAAFLVGAFIGPYMAAHFMNALSPKPQIQILQDKSAIVPMWGESWVLVKIITKNNGNAPEANVTLQLTVPSPWIFENNLTWFGYTFSSIAGGQAMMLVVNVKNPLVTQLQHGSFSIHIAAVGATKIWDSADLSESW